jgi:two-component system, chemotaxis family, sensor kinase CheA
MEDLFQKFKKQFVNEIFELLESLENDLLQAEKMPGDPQLIDSIFRAMHTIKGTSAMYGCKNISDFTHHLESIYQNIRDKKESVDKNIIDVSLASLDHIRNMLNDEKMEQPANVERNDELLTEITKYVGNINTEDNSILKAPVADDKLQKTQSWYILLRTDEQIFFRGVSLINIFTDLSEIGNFYIHRIPSLSSAEAETWGIVLISQSSINDIKEIFMFIEDNCTFVLLKEGDFKDEKSIQQFVEKQAVEIVSQQEISATEGLLPTNEEIKAAVEITEQPKTSLKIKTSLLVAEAAKQNLKRISVDSSKLDYLMYLVSELITLNSQMLLTTRDDYYESIRPQVEQMESLVKLFRSNALEIRLVPLGDLIIRFQRLVRDLSKQLGKKIDFITRGTDIELDKNTIDLLAEPIIHIIRNCVDHGIEMPDERITKGKPETGTITLSAKHVGNYIHISIDDDGAGLNLDKIRQKAIQKGIIKPGDNLTKAELSNLIFHSGFSTAENITDVSGRGVGMDVVRRKISELRGDIAIDTEKDKGTTFLLKIQQSIAIVDSLLFRVQNSFFILPLTDIEICIHTPKEELIKNKNTCTISYNEKMIPFFDIRSHFNLKGSYPDLVKTLILKYGDQNIGLLSDEILGEQQAVLKTLGQLFKGHSDILAVSQHGDGKWAYLLNTGYIHQLLKDKMIQSTIEN